MKREKARLETLRSMTYTDYLLTPEWQETQAAAITRAGNRCQVCNAENVPLSAYHKTSETLGCEQEGDLIVLCEGCADLFQQNGRLAEAPGEAGEQTSPDFSFRQKAAVFVPAAVATMGLPALLHAPLPAELFGLAAALALATKSPQIYAEMRDALPQPLVELVDGMEERKRARAATGEWSNWDRLWGRHLHTSPPGQVEELERADSLPDDQRDYLHLGPTLTPHADSLLSGRKVILGTSGSGKTNTTNVYCEELARLDPAPALILFDTDDENRALCSRTYLPHPIWLDKSRQLTARNAFEAAQTIMERRYQCIINLQSYEDEEAAWIMIYMIKGVRAWQEAREVRIPCEIVLDEASVWLPQNPRESALSSILVDDPDALEDDEETGKDKASKKIALLALLQRAFFSTVVRRGRRRGMGFTLAAQRIAEIDKRALQGSWMFLMRQTQPADFREYAKYGITPEEAMGLLDGEAFVFAPGKPREKHRLRKSDSPHGGVTPGMKALRGSVKGGQRTAEPKPAEALAPSLPELQRGGSAASEMRKHTDGAMLQLQDTRDEPVADGVPVDRPRLRSVPRKLEEGAQLRHPGVRLPRELRAALDAYKPGMTYRQLGAALGYGDSEARELFSELKRRGLLRASGQVEGTEKQDAHMEGTARPALYEIPRPQQEQKEELKKRPIDPADLAKAFALWQSGASSVRKLEAAAKAAGYGWSNGMCRDLTKALADHGLIPKQREAGVM